MDSLHDLPDNLRFSLPLQPKCAACVDSFSNLYLWNARGRCLDEHQGALHHDSIVGLDFWDLAPAIHNLFREGWELALNGESSCWIDDSGEFRPLVLSGLIPHASFRGMKVDRVLGFLIPLGEVGFKMLGG